jgi:hypothetical protein
MDRNRTKDRTSFGGLDAKTRELTEVELDFVSGGSISGSSTFVRSLAAQASINSQRLSDAD